jgi:cobaltochelatase CobT
MDAATALANDAHYLDQHLRDVVRHHEQQGAVGIVSVGVGLDLSAFYARSYVLDPGGAIGRAMFGEVLDLLDSRRRR